MTAVKRPDVALPIAPDAPPVRAPTIPVQKTESPAPSDAAQKQVEQDTRQRALESAEKLRQAELMEAQRVAAQQEQLRKDAARAEQTARSEAARMEAERQELARQRQERARQDEKAQQEAARQELERAEAARLEAARQEAVKQEAARQERARQDEKAEQDAARQDLERAEAARRDAARKEATRQEQARQAQTRLETARQEAARQDAAKQEAVRQERAKQEQSQKEQADQEKEREERLRAIGRQLAEEAAQRDAASNRPSKSLLPTVSSLRRGWLFGRADPNADLVQYAEAMSRKIEMNMTIDMVREVVKQPHARPIVTVAIRADGSVEKVTFVVSSGVPAIDDAIRKVVASQAPYGAFPPALARQYDVIEIRRTWIFDIAIRLQ